MLEFAILGLLHQSPMHGYELRKQLAQVLGGLRSISYGSLYPALKRMHAAGLISTDEPDPHALLPADAPPLTGRRGKVVYTITVEGKERFHELVCQTGPEAYDDGGSFGVRLAFFRHTASDVRLRVLEGRRRTVERQREGLRASLARTRERLDHYTLELQRHGLESVDREVRWLSELIDTERREAGAPPPSAGRRRTAHHHLNSVGVSGPVRSRQHRTVRGPRPRATGPGRRRVMGSVKVAIVGVGNCAASLVQGVEYYKDADESGSVPGLMHVRFGDYHVSDIEFVAAFDVDAKKVGRDLSEAIVASENNTIKICDVPPVGVTVQRGTTLDGLGKYYRETIEESDEQPVDMVAALRESGADVLVCYLPVGSQHAAEFYAQAAIDAGVAFVNALPVFIAGTQAWADKFTAAGVPIIGDDIKSQVGATITHRVLAKLFEDRGVQLDRTMQLNVGGNMDFKNMLERERLESKKISKTQSVTSQVDRDMGQGNVHIGPSDHVPWLSDRKWAYVRLEGRAFGDVPLSLEYKLEVWDSPNSAGIIIDAVRAAKIAKDRGIGGPILSASSYFMKSPPVQHRDSEAHDLVEAFIRGDVER